MQHQVADFFRLYDPGRLHEAATLVASWEGSSVGRELAALEAHYSKPGFFATSAHNFYGSAFDALATLYDPHVVPPVPCAVPLDNVHKAGVLLPKRVREDLEAAGAAVGEASAGCLHGAEAEARDQRQGTLLNWVSAAFPSEGPLGSLRAWREAGALVTVLLANRTEARGRLRGIDGGFNTLLLDASGQAVLYPGERVVGIALAANKK
jgi:small nuclear ribonucleoprotein (snRNP)-like protein